MKNLNTPLSGDDLLRIAGTSRQIFTQHLLAVGEVPYATFAPEPDNVLYYVPTRWQIPVDVSRDCAAWEDRAYVATIECSAEVPCPDTLDSDALWEAMQAASIRAQQEEDEIAFPALAWVTRQTGTSSRCDNPDALHILRFAEASIASRGVGLEGGQGGDTAFVLPTLFFDYLWDTRPDGFDLRSESTATGGVGHVVLGDGFPARPLYVNPLHVDGILALRTGRPSGPSSPVRRDTRLLTPRRRSPESPHEAETIRVESELGFAIPSMSVSQVIPNAFEQVRCDACQGTGLLVYPPDDTALFRSACLKCKGRGGRYVEVPKK